MDAIFEFLLHGPRLGIFITPLVAIAAFPAIFVLVFGLQFIWRWHREKRAPSGSAPARIKPGNTALWAMLLSIVVGFIFWAVITAVRTSSDIKDLIG